MRLKFIELLLGTALLGVTIGCQINSADLESADNRLRIEIVAGSPTGDGYQDGLADSAKFRKITSMALGESGNLYVTDNWNELIRMVSLQKQQVTTVAGKIPIINTNYKGDKDGPLGVSELLRTQGITPDGTGKFYVVDSNKGTIRQIAPDGHVTTLVGSSNTNKIDFRNGPLTEATFFNPYDLALDKAGNLYVTDLVNSCIRKISTDKIVSTFAGLPRVYGNKDGGRDFATFDGPTVLTIDSQENLFTAEFRQARIRKITPTGEVSTLAGGGEDGLTAGYQDGPGKTALFGSEITDIVFDPAGSMYVSDVYNRAIRKIDLNGTVSTVVGKKVDGGKPLISEAINALAFDQSGNLYAATERVIYRIRLK
jgi:sugar lactone lactonase YvrE